MSEVGTEPEAPDVEAILDGTETCFDDAFGFLEWIIEIGTPEDRRKAMSVVRDTYLRLVEVAKGLGEG